MSDASLIQTLTLNQASYFTTPTGIDRVKVHNDSGYYLRVYFGLGPPSNAMGSGWHATVSPGASPVVPVVGAAAGAEGLDLTNSRTTGTYQGQVIVLPFLPVGAPIPGGVISGAALCYLTGYYPDEAAEAGGQVEAFVQAAKQGRYQSVIGGMISWLGAPLYTDETTADSTVLTGDMIALAPASQPALFAANAAATTFSEINMYVWAYQCVMRARTPAVCRVNAWVEGVLTSSTFTVKANTSLIPLELTAVNFGNDRFLFLPPFPMLVRLLVTPNNLVSGDLVGFRYRIDTNAGHTPIGSFELAHSWSFQVDAINESPLYALSSPDVQITNNFPWNATYNPQTY